MASTFHPVLRMRPKRCKTEVQAARAAATADEDAVGAYAGSHLLGAGSGHAVEEGDSDRRAIANGGRCRGAGDGNEELVEGVRRGGRRAWPAGAIRRTGGVHPRGGGFPSGLGLR